MQFFEKLNACMGTGLDARKKGGCGWEELGPIVNELLKNLMLVGIVIAIGMIMYAGFVLVQGQGSSAARSQAKKIFINIFIGLFLLVGSYYIVDFILDTLNVNSTYRKDTLLN